MLAAITMIPETGRISPVFDAAGHAVLIDFCGRRPGPRGAVCADLPAGAEARCRFLEEKGVRLLITGAIAREDAHRLEAMGITLCPFVSGEWREVWGEWLRRGALSPCRFMPGCGPCRRRGGPGQRKRKGCGK